MRTRILLSAAEMAAEEIRDLIESGTLRPGQRINADELAERLSLSRTPIRDALQDLRTEGLVEIQPRKGVFVRQVSVQEVEDVYQLKAAIEPLAAAWAAKRGRAEAKQELAAVQEKLEAAGAAGDVRLAAEYVDEIHTKLFTMAGSEVLLNVYRVLHGRVKLLRVMNMGQPGRLDISIRQHAEIVKFVIAGNANRASKVMAQHMTDAAISVRKVIQ